jgi:hypothetical protein
LIRKYHGITPDGGSLVGIYLWESVAAANAFYTPDWRAMVTKRWQGHRSVTNGKHLWSWKAPNGGLLPQNSNGKRAGLFVFGWEARPIDNAQNETSNGSALTVSFRR